MTFRRVSAFFLSLILAESLWIGVRALNGSTDAQIVPTDARTNEGKALEAFFNSTWPTSNFHSNKTCEWNTSLVVCDGESKRVTTLKLSGLGLAGIIPAETISNLTGLVYLDLSNNRLSGGLPVVDHLMNLTKMFVGKNNFTGSLSDHNFSPALVSIDLTHNSFQGAFPFSLTNLSGLEILKLGSNLLSGDVTGLIHSLKSVASLKELDLSSNNFAGKLFPVDLSHLPNLTSLNLSSNNFLRHIFPTLTSDGLQNLILAGTNMAGRIPDTLSSIVTLTEINLADNDLNETVPAKIGNLSKLQMLDLSNNNLSGRLPDSLQNLKKLSTFNVSNNSLSGPVPTGISTFPSDSFLGNLNLCGAPLRTKCPILAPARAPARAPAGSKSSNIGAIVGGVVGGLVFVILVAVALLFWCRHSRSVKPLARDESRQLSGPMQHGKDAETWATRITNPGCIAVLMFEKPLLHLSFADLMQATGNFSKEMQVADGGYGPVYKGILRDGTQLAVKVLVNAGFPDDKTAAEKIESLSKVRHPNLVSLIGYCLVGEDSLLVYEFMTHGDLQRWLHELPDDTANPEDWSRDKWEHSDGVEDTGDYLNWPTRHKIALGTARALAFLHHGCSPHVIHRDVKTGNILLDENFEAHLVDSGLAGVSRVNGNPIIGGTVGYVPPEYGQTWQATTRGDVYSFGVVLLELVTGRKPTGHYSYDSHEGNLVGWVRAMIKLDKRGQRALDPKLVSRGYVPEMLEVLRIGYLCTSEIPAKRPTMQQVVGLLKDLQASAMS